MGLKSSRRPGTPTAASAFAINRPHGKSYLFTGDAILPINGRWSCFVVEQYGGTFEAMEESLRTLRDLDPDIVIPSAYVGEVVERRWRNGEWASIIDHRVERLREIAPA